AAPAITAVLVFEDVVQAFKGLPQSAELFAKLSSGIRPGLKFGTGPDKRLLETPNVLSRVSEANCGGI
ncbi:hypothetical protein A2U01_0094126, partial [Trifolium medium]|nr:hypothetical protein [Trifolium medium]